MKKPSRGCFWILGIICVAILIVVVLDTFLPSKAVRNLPEGATDIQEHYEDVGFTGDFVRVVKARIPESEVAEYARRVGATRKEAGGAGSDYFSWTGAASWFAPENPPMYFHYEPGYRILVGWEDGYVYFDAAAW
ncbi:hypothetical protein [Persicirhabdus sediminis]|uniref:Uncharacterized protein n=1 Tax=Persicirhabdus sediminis TaxID=454144 RepID=A0A8J7SLR9_9BACT|nr:hypothetical protein [Persicirhabdus sediminis]MBK1789984.1 hypothetical protein [Persicirhabdus sediminis]MBK1790593.1 hypothetical protein [Persicirhabdus sediminis]